MRVRARQGQRGAEDRCDAFVGAGGGEAGGAVEPVAVGHRDRGHPESGYPSCELLGRERTLLDGEVGAYIEVCKGCHHVVRECYLVVTMIRTQIQLTEEQTAKLKRLAVERDVSMAEVIREAVDLLPDRGDRTARWERALEAIRGSRFRDVEGKTDVAERHDEYLADIYEQDLRKR